MSDRATKLVELSSVKGDIANLILSMIGADKQRSLDSLMFKNGDTDHEYNKGDDKLDYIHALEDFNNSYTDAGDKDYTFDTGLSTIYISNMVLLILLTLNKYVQNASYKKETIEEKKFKFGKPTSNQTVSPYAQHYSSTLFQILKNGQFQFVDEMNSNEVTFYSNSETKDLIEYKRVNDLLNDDILFDIDSKNFGGYDPKKVINSNLRTSETNFLENMRKIILKFYTWYGMDKVAHLEKMLNATAEQCNNTLDLTLKISLQRILTEFTTTITNNEANPNKYLPLSELYEDIIDQLASIPDNNTTRTTKMFDCENENSLTLYAAVEEDLHMVNIEGTAIHSILELINRMLDERTKDKDYWTEDQIRSNINDAVGMLSNLFGQCRCNDSCLFVDDPSNYGDDSNIKTYFSQYSYNGWCNDNNVVELLHVFENLYDETLECLNNETIKDDGDFNSSELDKIGLIKILENLSEKTVTNGGFVRLPNINTDAGKNEFKDLFNTFHFSKSQVGGMKKDLDYEPYFDTNRKNQIKVDYLDKFNKYGSPEHGKNFAAVILKLLFILVDFYIIRQTQEIHAEGSPYLFMMRSPNYKEELLNRKPPTGNYSLTDIIRIQSLRENLENKNNKLKTRNIVNDNFNKPDEYSELTEDIIEQINTMIYYFGIDNSSDKQNTTYNPIEITNNIKCCYPIIRTIMYYFDNFFNRETHTNKIDINKNNNVNDGTYNCFEILTNYLTYVAMAIINDRGYAQEDKKDNIFSIDDFELSCMDLAYLFNTITTNWSDKDGSALNAISVNNPTWEFSSLYPYLEDGEQSSHLSAILRDIDTIQLRTTNNFDTNTTFDVLTIKSIKNTMIKMINSDNLSSFVKLVYFMTLFVTNGVCMHFIKGNYNKMIK